MRTARIGTRIRQFREAGGLSLGDLGNRPGIQPPNFSRPKSGIHDPSVETLEHIAASFSVRPVDIVVA